jgi:hypothetical protein
LRCPRSDSVASRPNSIAGFERPLPTIPCAPSAPAPSSFPRWF